MLIICNGAFKCGSSWLHAILVELLKIKNISLSRIPDDYTNDIYSPTKIIESKLDDFVLKESYEYQNYITKSHFFKRSTLSSPYPDDVKFLFVEREVKDAIVSHYYHIKNRFQINISFRFYYFIIGQYKAYEIHLFNHRCKEYFGESHFISYDDLKNRFPDSIQRLCKILDIGSLNTFETQRLIDETTIESLREKSKSGESEYYPSKRKDNWKQFRRGKQGDWVNYFSKKQLHQIENIERKGTSLFFKVNYFFLFTLRRYLGRIE